eukprot:584091-Rhodomonas_salina.6
MWPYQTELRGLRERCSTALSALLPALAAFSQHFLNNLSALSQRFSTLSQHAPSTLSVRFGTDALGLTTCNATTKWGGQQAAGGPGGHGRGGHALHQPRLPRRQRPPGALSPRCVTLWSRYGHVVVCTLWLGTWESRVGQPPRASMGLWSA